MFRVNDEGAVRTLTIDNPARRNAIGADEWVALAEAFEGFEASDARVLVIRGAGEDFCSGLDVASGGSVQGGIAGWTSTLADVSRAARALFAVSKPVIAAVDGVAVGAGMNLALGADVIVASDRARFAELFVKRGLTVDFGGIWLLPRLVGLARAKELALTGRLFGATEAFEYGIVTEIVAVDRLHARSQEVAAELASGAPLAQRFIKAGLDHSFDMSFEEALAYESQAQTLLLTSEDAAEGMISFLEKRPPEFKGR